MRKVLISLAVVVSVIMMSSFCIAGDTSISGYADFQLRDAQNAVTTFDLNEVSVKLSTEIAKDKVNAEVELATDGAGGVDLDTATISLNPIDNLTAYAGLFDVPFGIETDSSDPDVNPLITRPTTTTGWTDVGIGASYAIEGVGAVDLYVINGDVANPDQAIDNNNSKSVGLRVSVSEALKGLNVGGSFVTGRYALDANNDGLNAQGVGGHLVVDIAELAGNKMLPTLTVEFVSASEEADTAADPTDDDDEAEALSIQLAAVVVENVEVAVRYGTSDADSGNANTLTEDAETSIGVAYTAYENTELKLEYKIVDKEFETNTDADDDNVLLVGLVVNW